MTLTWAEIKVAVTSELLSRNLKQPRLRMAALGRIEESLGRVCPGFQIQTGILLSHSEVDLRERLGALKPSGVLNGAETSVLHNVYQALRGELGSAWRRPAEPSGGTEAAAGDPIPERPNKLQLLAVAIAELLSSKFGRPARFALEYEHDWLDVLPTPEVLGSEWERVCSIYTSLVDGRFSLPVRMAQCEKDLQRGPQRVDIWFAEPYSFLVEFDEDQHFNQFRLRTLQEYSGYSHFPVDLDGYIQQCRARQVKPGTSGFTRLRRYDPLFPPMLEGEAQDNRARQRAFRDLLKDVVPSTRADTNPTWRIGSYVVGGKRSGFTQTDCLRIVEHLRQLRVPDCIEFKD